MGLVLLLVKVYSVYMKKIYKIKGDNLIITVPMKAVRSNPWDDDFHPEMDNIMGLYEGDYNNGLCYRIDMDYKGKSDQWTDYFFKLNGTREEFITMCEELGIDFILDEMPDK